MAPGYIRPLNFLTGGGNNNEDCNLFFCFWFISALDPKIFDRAKLTETKSKINKKR